jgi:hypothetical protein
MQKPLSRSDLGLLSKEVEIIEGMLEKHRLETTASIDRLSLELKAMQETLTKLIPEFGDTIQKTRDEMLQSFDPEAA